MLAWRGTCITFFDKNIKTHTHTLCVRAQQQANALRQWDLHVAACKELHLDNGWNNPFIQFLTSQGNFFRFLPFIRRRFCVYPINKTYLLFDDTFLRFNSIIFHLVLIFILSCVYITIKEKINFIKFIHFPIKKLHNFIETDTNGLLST